MAEEKWGKLGLLCGLTMTICFAFFIPAFSLVGLGLVLASVMKIMDERYEDKMNAIHNETRGNPNKKNDLKKTNKPYSLLRGYNPLTKEKTKDSSSKKRRYNILPPRIGNKPKQTSKLPTNIFDM